MQRQQAQRVGDRVVGERVDPVRDVDGDHRRRIRIDHQRHRQHRQHRHERQHEADQQRAAHLRQHDVDAARASAARRDCAPPRCAASRATPSRRPAAASRTAPASRRTRTTMPRQSSMLCAASGSISPDADQHVIEHAVLGEERPHHLAGDDERNEQRPPVEPAQDRRPRAGSRRASGSRRSRWRRVRSAPSTAARCRP